MLSNEKLKDFNDKTNDFQYNCEDIDHKLYHMLGTKKDYFKFISMNIIPMILLMMFSYWLYINGLFELENMTNEEDQFLKTSLYYRAMLFSFFASFSSSFLLFFSLFYTVKQNDYREKILFQNMIESSAASILLGFLAAFLLVLIYPSFLELFNLTWSFYHNFIVFCFFLLFSLFLINKKSKYHFNNKKEQEKHVLTLKKRKKDLEETYDKKYNNLKKDIINSINSIDNYNLLKLTCTEMKLVHVESLYNEIEKKLLKKTEFNDFEIYEKSIIRHRSSLKTIDNI